MIGAAKIVRNNNDTMHTAKDAHVKYSWFISQKMSTQHAVCLCMCVANKGQNLRLVREFLETQLPPECTLVAVIISPVCVCVFFSFVHSFGVYSCVGKCRTWKAMRT